MANTQRITISLPNKVVDDLNFISKTAGMSRSAFLSALLTESLPPMIPLVQIAASGSKDGDSRRYRGAAIEFIDAAISRLASGSEALQDDLFSK